MKFINVTQSLKGRILAIGNIWQMKYALQQVEFYATCKLML